MIGPFVFEDVSSEPNSGFGAIAEEISHKLIPNWISFTVQFAAMVIMILVIFFVAYKPVKKIMTKRADYIEANIRDAETAKAEANKNIVASEEMVIASKKEAAEIVSQAKVTAEENSRAKLEETTLEINKMKEDAKADIERSKLEAREEIRQEMVSVAIAASEEVLKREINEKDNARLVEDFIKEID